MSDRGFETTAEDRRQLLEANVVAAEFFREELLWATAGWPLQYLKDEGIDHVLAPDSPWKVGYAPNTERPGGSSGCRELLLFDDGTRRTSHPRP